MTRRVRDRATFEALTRARRIRRGPLSLRYVAAPSAGGRGRDVPRGRDDTVPRVAYAISRSTGSAVRRNRIRRRLRAAMHQADVEGRVAPGAYLLGAGAEALTMPFGELEHVLGQLLDAAGGGRA